MWGALTQKRRLILGYCVAEKRKYNSTLTLFSLFSVKPIAPDAARFKWYKKSTIKVSLQKYQRTLNISVKFKANV